MIVTAIDLSHGLEGILNSLMTQGAALGMDTYQGVFGFYSRASPD